MNVSDECRYWLDKAGGDPHHALTLAVRHMGILGYHISAGFVRAAPPRPAKPPKEHVDGIPDPDPSPKMATPSA